MDDKKYHACLTEKEMRDIGVRISDMAIQRFQIMLKDAATEIVDLKAQLWEMALELDSTRSELARVEEILMGHYEDEYFRCEGCKKVLHQDDFIEDEDGNFGMWWEYDGGPAMCPKCTSEKMKKCPKCNEMFIEKNDPGVCHHCEGGLYG